MRRAAVAAVLVLLLGAPRPAQTTGVPGINDLTFNGLGSGTTSCGTATLNAGGDTGLWAINGSPAHPVILAVASSCQPASLTLDPVVPYTLDLDLASFGVVVDGTGTLLPPSFFTPFSITDANGFWSLGLWLDLNAGPWMTFQGALVGPFFPTGMGTTQALDVVASPSLCFPGANPNTNIGAGEDTSTNFLFTGSHASFTFYGQSYQDVWVNANGNLTFCAGDSDFSPSQVEFLGSPTGNDALPRIAPAWNDWSPQVGGAVHVIETDDTFDVMWCQAVQFGCFALDPNAFRVTLDKTNGVISMEWSVLNFCGGSHIQDIIVGVSPGFDTGGTCPAAPLSPVTTLPPADLDTFPVGGASYDAVWERFPATGTNPWDLDGKSYMWVPAVPDTYAVQ